MFRTHKINMTAYSFLLLAVAHCIFHSAEGNLCELPNVENGKIAQYYYSFRNFYFPMGEGKKLAVACSAGYTFTSGKQEEHITCTSQGWDPPAICYKKCIKPSLVNGIVHNVKDIYKTSEKTEYSCIKGYTTKSGQNVEEIECSSGSWNPPPECHQISDRCEAPPLHNGMYTTTKRIFQIKEILQYQCDTDYYTASGSTVDWVECLSHGWSSIPHCTRSSCGRLKPVENGGFNPVKASYADKEVVQFFCRENFLLKGSELIQCYSYGWDPEPPVCEERAQRCPPPPRPAYSILLTKAASYRTGDSAQYECNDNYMLIGTEHIHCENGHWTTPPTCIELREKIKCDKPPTIDNGAVTLVQEVYYSGDSVFYKCTDGYEIQGLSEIFCKKGKWTETPICTINLKNCQRPPEISHGEISDALLDSYTDGSSIEYRCHSYHLMEGSKAVNCTQGTWSQPPKCLQPCTVSVANLKEKKLELQWSFEMNSRFLHGDMVEFKCMDGFYATTPSVLKGVCQNGKMLYPSCGIKDAMKPCGPPPVVMHGTANISLQVFTSGSLVVYHCLEHYFLNGQSKVHCSDGQWDDPPSCIAPCILSSEEMSKRNVRLKWNFYGDYILHGEFVEFLCKTGYENYETTVTFALRSQCKNGRLKYPQCVPRSG